VIGNIELLSRLVLAALLGSAIGFERERLNWAAGLRTHMLVCVGSSLIMTEAEALMGGHSAAQRIVDDLFDRERLMSSG
jgi:uncharacterized membrane protein YhiD involved in acid resistance